MKWKCIIIGAVVFWLAMNILGMATGPLIHNGVLAGVYDDNASFWRPELNEEPPNMGALMPMWLLNSFIGSLIFAWLYCRCSCGDGPGWKRGLGFGFGLGVFACSIYLAWFGIFNLPTKIWMYWGIETLVSYSVCAAAMGWAVAKWGGD